MDEKVLYDSSHRQKLTYARLETRQVASSGAVLSALVQEVI